MNCKLELDVMPDNSVVLRLNERDFDSVNNAAKSLSDMTFCQWAMEEPRPAYEYLKRAVGSLTTGYCLSINDEIIASDYTDDREDIEYLAKHYFRERLPNEAYEPVNVSIEVVPSYPKGMEWLDPDQRPVTVCEIQFDSKSYA